METVRVSNLMSNRSGRPVANQFNIYANGKRYFQSYSAVIACIDSRGNVTLDETYWDYLRTTSRYRNQFLGESTTEIQRKVKSGEYKLADLN